VLLILSRVHEPHSEEEDDEGHLGRQDGEKAVRTRRKDDLERRKDDLDVAGRTHNCSDSHADSPDAVARFVLVCSGGKEE
jgi:hypothetical protein